jgi:sec-independent protein translocase protein TatB
MEFLGIGMPELVFIILIAMIVLGPRDMQKAGRTIGRWLRELTTSDGWKVFQRTSREIRSLPTRLMREAQFEELDQELHQTLDPRQSFRTSAKAGPGESSPSAPEPPSDGEDRTDA